MPPRRRAHSRMSPVGTSRRFAALQNFVAIGVIADIEQAEPSAFDFISMRASSPTSG
jgi:hypothetical protein